MPYEDCCWNDDKSTPYRSETDGIAENAVHRMKEGASDLLFQSGPSEMWWRAAMDFFFAKHTTQTCRQKSDCMEEDLEHHLMVQGYRVGLK